MYDFPERDWKVLRKHKDSMLNGYCEKVFKKMESLMKNPDKTPHERYLKLWKLIRNEDRKIGHMFDDWRRSTASLRIYSLLEYGVMTEDIFSELTEETQNEHLDIINFRKKRKQRLNDSDYA